MNASYGSRNTRLLLKRARLLKHRRKQSAMPKRSKLQRLQNASSPTTRSGFIKAMLLSSLLLTACASQPVVAPYSRPQLPPPPAEIMKPVQPNFLSRMESFLSGNLPAPMP